MLGNRHPLSVAAVTTGRSRVTLMTANGSFADNHREGISTRTSIEALLQLLELLHADYIRREWTLSADDSSRSVFRTPDIMRNNVGPEILPSIAMHRRLRCAFV